MILALITLLAIIAGFILGRYLYPTANTLVAIGIGTLLGIGLYIISMYLLGLVGISWTRVTLTILALTMLLCSLPLIEWITIPVKSPNQYLGIVIVLFFTSFSIIVNS